MKNDILMKLLQRIPADLTMTLPPKVFVDMEGEFIDYVEGEYLRARFPNKERYKNPFGFMQGGIIVAAMDNTMSPLSYAVSPPNITKEISATFKRPIKGCVRFIDVVARVMNRTSTGLILQAEVMNEKEKLAARGIAHCVYIRRRG